MTAIVRVAEKLPFAGLVKLLLALLPSMSRTLTVEEAGELARRKVCLCFGALAARVELPERTCLCATCPAALGVLLPPVTTVPPADEARVRCGKTPLISQVSVGWRCGSGMVTCRGVWRGGAQATFLVSWVPLVNMLVLYLKDMLCFFQRHHFYTSASS